MLIFQTDFLLNFEIAAVQKYANLVELEKCCETHIFLQNFVLIQPRTSPPKVYKHLAKRWPLIFTFSELFWPGPFFPSFRLWTPKAVQRSALCRSRRELSNAYLVFTCKMWLRYTRERALQSLPDRADCGPRRREEALHRRGGLQPVLRLPMLSLTQPY